MGRISEFIRVNGIKQRDLALYLGIGEPSVSKMAKGLTNPSKENLHKLLNNTKGWDTSMLMGETTTINQVGQNNIVGTGNEIHEKPSALSLAEQAELIQLRSENQILRQQLEWAMGLIEKQFNTK